MLLAAATVAGALAASATDAAAGRRGFGPGLAVGVVGGLMLGSAIAASRPAYVVEGPVVVGPRACVVEEQVWSPRYQAYVLRPVRVPC